MKKKTVLLALMLAGVMGLSGCKTWDVVCDILAVGTTKVEKDDGPKVDLEGETPEVKDDDSTDLETADSKTTSGNDEKEKDTKKNTTKGSDRTDKKRVTMPSGTSEPSHTTTPTPTPTPSGIEKKEKSGHMITCTSPVNVRDAASSQSRVIGELAKGDQVEKLGEDGGWVKIRYQGQEAWVYEDYMSEKNSRKEETKTEKSKQTDHSADKNQKPTVLKVMRRYRRIDRFIIRIYGGHAFWHGKDYGEKENDKKGKNASEKTETENDVWRWITACGGCVYCDSASARF